MTGNTKGKENTRSLMRFLRDGRGTIKVMAEQFGRFLRYGADLDEMWYAAQEAKREGHTFFAYIRKKREEEGRAER